jgi:hypothetical protein
MRLVLSVPAVHRGLQRRTGVRATPKEIVDLATAAQK